MALHKQGKRMEAEVFPAGKVEVEWRCTLTHGHQHPDQNKDKRGTTLPATL